MSRLTFLYQMDLPHRDVSIIAKEIKLSQATIRRAIKDLRSAGLVETTQRYRTKGGTSTLLFKISSNDKK